MPRQNTSPADYPQAVLQQIEQLAQNIVVARKRRGESQAQRARPCSAGERGRQGEGKAQSTAQANSSVSGVVSWPSKHACQLHALSN